MWVGVIVITYYNKLEVIEKRIEQVVTREFLERKIDEEIFSSNIFKCYTGIFAL